MDGSHIEGSHKAWNSLQRAHPSGIEVYTGLFHDFFLRRNIRIASARIQNHRSVNFHEFIASAHTSHHIQLVNHTAELFNLLYAKEPPASKGNLDMARNLASTQTSVASTSVSTTSDPSLPSTALLPATSSSQKRKGCTVAMAEEPTASIDETPNSKWLTRSQLLFSIGTSIDPRVLQITDDNEFYLFMDMRAEFQWTSFGMTVSKWASAAKIYNEQLEALGKTKNIEILKKNPRALTDKLSEIEPKISERILKQNYLCT
ncbi:hypothetical protein BDZ97DRAFT_1902759 [Flammula alnicola]|nr:hypothetical protein BDZ97DRAFT_1902759 [Flammula alnicola]